MKKPIVNRRADAPPIFGLSFIPTLEPGHSDYIEYFGWHVDLQPEEGDNSYQVLGIVEEITGVAPPGGILEIGVAHYEAVLTFTNRLFRAKPDDKVYLGVDIANRSFVTSWAKNAHFYWGSSLRQGEIRSKLQELNALPLSLLIIDGGHSVPCALNDWEYADLVAPGGYVLIHDSNSHPGPIALVAAIDRAIFEVGEPLANSKDYGIAIAKRIA
jgi:hypothetical protein